MASLRTVIASLGNAGAISNAHLGIEQREREEWLVARLEANLAPSGALAPLAPDRGAARRVAA